MALVHCPKCGHENISESFRTCPYCGNIMNQYRQETGEEAERQQEEFQKAEYERILKDNPDIAKEIEKEGIENVCKQLEVAKKYQKKMIHILKKQLRTERKMRALVIVWSIIWTIAFIWSYSMNEKGALLFIMILSIFCAIVGWILLILTNGSVYQMEREIQKAMKNIEEYQIIIDTK